MMLQLAGVTRNAKVFPRRILLCGILFAIACILSGMAGRVVAQIPPSVAPLAI